MRKPIFSLLAASLLFGTASPGFAGEQSPSPDPKIKVGDVAPDFKLRDQNGKEVKLSDYHGQKNVVLAFYVFAFTGG